MSCVCSKNFIISICVSISFRHPSDNFLTSLFCFKLLLKCIRIPFRLVDHNIYIFFSFSLYQHYGQLKIQQLFYTTYRSLRRCSSSPSHYIIYSIVASHFLSPSLHIIIFFVLSRFVV